MVGVKRAVLVTGATGFLGTIVTAALIAREDRSVVALVRSSSDLKTFKARLAAELRAEGIVHPTNTLVGRLNIVSVKPETDISETVLEVATTRVEETIHCAGCVDYFNTPALEAANIDFTKTCLLLSRLLDVDRFVFLSTAYASGYIEGLIPERPHNEPLRDPTEYARTKRQAEHIILESSLPFLIIRPTILIGDSTTGRYSGKRYGLYQGWDAFIRLLCDRRYDELHLVAPQQPTNFLHQDSFLKAFFAARRSLPCGTIMHLASRPELAPSVRELYNIWFDALGWPQQVHWYDRLEDVPLAGIPSRQRAFLMFTSVNAEISAHDWRFETTIIDRLRQEGLQMTDSTLSSLRICQDRFLKRGNTVT